MRSEGLALYYDQAIETPRLVSLESKRGGPKKPSFVKVLYKGKNGAKG